MFFGLLMLFFYLYLNLAFVLLVSRNMLLVLKYMLPYNSNKVSSSSCKQLTRVHKLWLLSSIRCMSYVDKGCLELLKTSN